MIVVFLGIVKC